MSSHHLAWLFRGGEPRSPRSPGWSASMLIRKEGSDAAHREGVGTSLLRVGVLLSLGKSSCSCVSGLAPSNIDGSEFSFWNWLQTEPSLGVRPSSQDYTGPTLWFSKSHPDVEDSSISLTGHWDHEYISWSVLEKVILQFPSFMGSCQGCRETVWALLSRMSRGSHRLSSNCRLSLCLRCLSTCALDLD